jgi:ketosteroid isomerase-like protein
VRHPNIEIAERAWGAVANSDVDALARLWAPDIVWHVTSANPWSGDHVGPEAVLDYLASVGEAGEAYDANLEDVLVSDDRVLIVTRVTARRRGRSIDTQQCMLARIEDGRIAEVWTLALDPAAFAGFWESPARTAKSEKAAEAG